MHGPAARMLVAAIVAGISILPGRAAAQDFGIGPQREPTLTTSRLGLESSFATFDDLGGKGEYFGLTVRGDLKLARHVGLRLLLPAYAIQLEGQPVRTGLGDAELRVRFLLYDGHSWRFYWGIADQLPTGDSSIGLGQGGSQLTPFITGGWRSGSFVAYASVADAIGLHPQGKVEPAPDYVDPSSDHELRSTFGGIGEVTEALYFNAAVTAITLLEPGQLGTTLLVAGAALGYQLNDRAKLVLVGQLPIEGEHRFNERLGLDAYMFF